MKYFLIAGEASGDLHASNLMAELKTLDKHAEFQFFGGDLMQEQGGICLKHYREMAFMGVVPVLMHLKSIKKNLAFCKSSILKFQPDVVLLIDYPGFNLRIAKFAKENRFKTCYYISPKVWAWKTKRVYQIKAYVDELYSILPFEKEFFQKYNYSVHYVGNPILDSIQNTQFRFNTSTEFKAHFHLSKQPIIALLAGSRKDEIKRLLPIMLQVSKEFPTYQFVLAGAPNIDESFYQQYNYLQLPIVYDATYELIKNSDAAIVASGTATLETAILGTPQLVVYRMGMGWFLSLFRQFVLKTDYFSLVNIILDREIVKEFFHNQVNAKDLTIELNSVLYNKTYRQAMFDEYKELLKKLATKGASKTTATHIVESLNSK